MCTEIILVTEQFQSRQPLTKGIKENNYFYLFLIMPYAPTIYIKHAKKIKYKNEKSLDSKSWLNSISFI